MSKIIKRIGSQWMLISPANRWSINASSIKEVRYNEIFIGVPTIEVIQFSGRHIWIGKVGSFSTELLQAILKGNDDVFADDDLYQYLHDTLFLE